MGSTCCGSCTEASCTCTGKSMHRSSLLAVSKRIHLSVVSRDVHRIALVGSGPSSFYSAKYLLEKDPNVLVDMYEKLPVPFGLVRFGVAPDHPEVKSVMTTFNDVAQSSRFRYFGNVAIGSNKVGGSVQLQALLNSYSGVVLAYGATSDNDLKVPNEQLRGIYSARRFVNWYNGHPDYCKEEAELFSLEGVKNVVIIGQGNVAIDCARVLSRDLSELAGTDITKEALGVLAKSDVETVTLVGRRGHVQGAFTIAEFREMTRLKGVQVKIPEHELKAGQTDASKAEVAGSRAKKRLSELVETTAAAAAKAEASGAAGGGGREVHFRFLLSPSEFRGSPDDRGVVRVSSVLTKVNRLVGPANEQKAEVVPGAEVELPCQLVLKSVGYKCEPVDDEMPFDYEHNVVPSSQGRVRANTAALRALTGDLSGGGGLASTVRGLYVAGWLKRGCTGIIGTNIPDAKETVASVITDLSTGLLREVAEDPRGVLFTSADLSSVVQWSGYKKIDAVESERGKSSSPPKEREKMLLRSEMLGAANSVSD